MNRLMELANVGANHAVGAFSRLVDRRVWTEAPIIVEGSISSENDDDSSRDRWCTGIFFEFDGCLDAQVALLFPGAACEALVRRIVGVETGELSPSLMESALMEVGNIMASHVASAIADTLEARLLPSIPTLAMEDAEQALSIWIEQRSGSDTVRIECIFRDESGDFNGRLVMVPAPKFD